MDSFKIEKSEVSEEWEISVEPELLICYPMSVEIFPTSFEGSGESVESTIYTLYDNPLFSLHTELEGAEQGTEEWDVSVDPECLITYTVSMASFGEVENDTYNVYCNPLFHPVEQLAKAEEWEGSVNWGPVGSCPRNLDSLRNFPPRSGTMVENDTYEVYCNPLFSPESVPELVEQLTKAEEWEGSVNWGPVGSCPRTLDSLRNFPPRSRTMVENDAYKVYCNPLLSPVADSEPAEQLTEGVPADQKVAVDSERVISCPRSMDALKTFPERSEIYGENTEVGTPTTEVYQNPLFDPVSEHDLESSEHTAEEVIMEELKVPVGDLPIHSSQLLRSCPRSMVHDRDKTHQSSELPPKAFRGELVGLVATEDGQDCEKWWWSKWVMLLPSQMDLITRLIKSMASFILSHI